MIKPLSGMYLVTQEKLDTRRFDFLQTFTAVSYLKLSKQNLYGNYIKLRLYISSRHYLKLMAVVRGIRL